MRGFHICICIGFADTQSPPSSTLVTLDALHRDAFLFWPFERAIVTGKDMFGVCICFSVSYGLGGPEIGLARASGLHVQWLHTDWIVDDDRCLL